MSHPCVSLTTSCSILHVPLYYLVGCVVQLTERSVQEEQRGYLVLEIIVLFIQGLQRSRSEAMEEQYLGQFLLG